MNDDNEGRQARKTVDELMMKLLMAMDDEEDKFAVIIAAARMTGLLIDCYVDAKEKEAVIKEAAGVFRACANASLYLKYLSTKEHHMADSVTTKRQRNQMKLNLAEWDLSDDCPACQALRANPDLLDLNGYGIMGEDGLMHTCQTIRKICREIEKADLPMQLRALKY